MRRDQVFKICLNHGLTSDIKFLRRDDRSWLWVAKDFSEGEGTTSTFVMRFRDVEVAESFMKAVENSLVFLLMHLMESKPDYLIVLKFPDPCQSR